ncbi:hypothetical protein MSTO_23960 [Mycobacterium stomatepiae]|uniref:Uncharacterized protein n=1 Tax=Mycobacterium stomatepiae TaxID=470076 RepID=A0A7I7Q7S9_9MYCO|nr:hypothetical protein MSTO_23960 [Mycobacterium stomatepiae]
MGAGYQFGAQRDSVVDGAHDVYPRHGLAVGPAPRARTGGDDHTVGGDALTGREFNCGSTGIELGGRRAEVPMGLQILRRVLQRQVSFGDLPGEEFLGQRGRS